MYAGVSAGRNTCNFDACVSTGKIWIIPLANGVSAGITIVFILAKMLLSSAELQQLTNFFSFLALEPGKF